MSAQTLKNGRPVALIAAGLAGLLAAGCAQIGAQGELAHQLRAPTEKPADETPQTELARAIDYWGKAHAQSPRELKPALAFARNLRAAGHRQQALAVLQQVAVFHGDDRELASEYGRLALDLGQVQIAEKALAMAEDPARPDWKLMSARGAVAAKKGEYKAAIPLFEKALALAPTQPSILNNLALAYAADGQAPRAEALLREAVAKGAQDPKVHQNLALVLSLQGKHDEARDSVAAKPAGSVVAGDVDELRKLVRAQPQQAPAAAGGNGAMVAGWSARVAPAPKR